jgi:NAD(P)-dependent dehydrogenase (short-subunit alcohol dehydrogenase family)
MAGRLAGKVAVITGATSGIGKATARLFAEEGCKVVLTGRRRALGAALEAELNASGGDVAYVPADHTRTEACREVVEIAVQKFGTIDILFNNAGIVTGGTAETTTDEVWEQTMAINVRAVWQMCKLVLPVMRAHGRGAIVNNGSDWSLIAGRDAFPYVTSKGAIALMTKSMALDYAADNIRVNAVCPGDTLVDRWSEQGYFQSTEPVSTENALQDSAAYIPLGRYARPEEIAKAVLFLASEDSSFVTGHLLLVDGGNTAQ